MFSPKPQSYAVPKTQNVLRSWTMLPSWASTLSGIGVQLVTAWQSVGQIEAAYGKQSQAILTNHLTKLSSQA